MFVSKVFVTPLDKMGNLKAFAAVELTNDGAKVACLKINGIKLMDGVNGLFISMPSTFKEKEDGK